MKKWIPLAVTVLAVIAVTRDAFRSLPESGGFDLQRFSELPVQTGGRVKPLDSVARNHLMILRGRTTVPSPDGEMIPAPLWLLEVAARPEFADTLPVFRIDNPDLLGSFGWSQEEKFYSFKALEPQLGTVAEARRSVNEDTAKRTSYERAVVKLYNAISLYHGLVHSFHPPDNSAQVEGEYAAFLAVLGPGMAQIRSGGDPEDLGESLGESGQRLIELLSRYRWLSQNASLGIQPPPAENIDRSAWSNIGEALLAVPATGQLPFAAEGYAALISSYRSGDTERFNTTAATLAERFENLDEGTKQRVRSEALFNRSEVFYNGLVVYVFALLTVLASWLFNSETARRSAVRLLLVGFVVHTIGIIARILIQGYAPITNLYSSAIFVGWGAVGLGLIFERVFRSGLAAASASVVGFITLIIAHHLSKSGDTMEMMRAVLDSNFWLATHVTIVTLGYVGTFLAGVMAIFFVFRGVLTKNFGRKEAASQATMVYVTICFAILTSFVGTMLGGIWADQSWGRFWGWDPKENGALLVVLWCAVILHARWGGIVRNRGLMMLAIGGNIVTAWSWFGTNMLGVGLHSYGFIDSAFYWLMAFIISQLAIIALAAVPRSRWRSPKAA